MASKRISKSAIDWKRFQGLVLQHEQPQFQQFMGRSFQYASRVVSLPESLPKIDFDAYKKQIPEKASVIDKFASSYSSLQVAYPKDAENVGAKIAASEKEAEGRIRTHLSKLSAVAAELQKQKDTITSLPPLEELTFELVEYYFPAKEVSNDELFGACPHAAMLEDKKKGHH